MGDVGGHRPPLQIEYSEFQVIHAAQPLLDTMQIHFEGPIGCSGATEAPLNWG